MEIGLERDAFLYVGDVDGGRAEVGSLKSRSAELCAERTGPGKQVRSIEELVRTGQELLIQVTKDPLPDKGARVTTQLSLPGRLLVLLPRSPVCGVSRRITDPQERERLLGLLQELVPAPEGAIVRTAGAGKGSEALRRDLDHLKGVWQRVQRIADGAAAPVLLRRELDLELRAVRDVFDDSLEAIRVSGAEVHRRIDAYLAELDPGLRQRLRPYDEELELFERYGVEREIEAALRRKVWLRSGGYIVVSPTEALVAIDVNTGRFIGAQSLEETVVQTNLEAAREIVRQIRLRNLGGIVVIDFIDMADPEHRRRVFETLERELERDRARNQVLGISDFGLVEITRKRSRPSLERLLTQACPCCQGRGRVKTPTTLCLDVRREALRNRARFEGRPLRLRVHPQLARAFEEQLLGEVEEALRTTIRIEVDPQLHLEDFEIREA